jgi:DNA polymerase IV
MDGPTRLCRDCGRLDGAQPHPAETCASCGSARIVSHPELASLSIAHVDCDAFYASVEKRDRPELADRPVIVGGGLRGVVLTCCYVARRSGVRSAMAMAHAVRLCPDATVIRPDMEKYRRESRRIRALMEEAAPVIEAVSIDEAYLDLTERMTDEPPARALARLALLVERRVGVTVSIGLAANKMLAKVASDLGKPRGFRVIGASDAAAVLGPMKVRVLPGVGPVTAARLEAAGFSTVADLREAKAQELTHRFGRWGERLARFARGEDGRRVGGGPRRNVTIGAEHTFERDLKELAEIEPELRRLCGKVANRLAHAGLAATALTLKLRRADRHTTTHACRPRDPTVQADTILATVLPVLARHLGAARYRLIGVTAHDLVPATRADPPDLFAETKAISID